MIRLLAAIAVISILPTASGAEATYSHSESFSTIRTSYSLLYSAVERLRSFIDTANRGAERKYEDESLRISAGSLAMTLDTGFVEKDLSGAPIAIDIWYSYTNRRAPISGVDIRLSDYLREVTVTGTSREQVDALAGLIAQDLRQFEGGIGGPTLRLIGGILLLLVGGLLAIASGIVQGFFRWLAVVSGLAFQVSLWVLPWQEWFPGTTVFPGEASFLVRNEPVLTFLGLVVTVLTPIATIAWNAYTARKSTTSADSEDEPAAQQADEADV
jgi:hypothetical protein